MKMRRGKLFAIEGTDASGKATQTDLLFLRLEREKIPIKWFTFPVYNSPTGKIIGGPLLGKAEIGPSYFEKASEVDPFVGSALYVADRRYHLPFINETLDSGINMSIDRYVYSNMIHQGGKIRDKNKREQFYRWLEKLEFEMFELPRPDVTTFLHMPTKYAIELKSKMINKGIHLDEVEKDYNYLKNSEESALHLAELYNWKMISCVKNGKIRSPQDIHEEVYSIFKATLNS